MQTKFQSCPQQQLIKSSRALSPVNLLTNKTHIYKQAILEQNKCLKRILSNLLEQLQKQRQKNKGISMQVKKQKQNQELWMEKYTDIVSEYEKERSLVTLKREDKFSQMKRMTRDNEEEYENTTTEASQAIEISFHLNVKRNSLQGKHNRKRQALSLTHLHRHHYEGARKFFCEK